MESVLSQALLFRDFLIDRVCPDIIGQGMMKHGIEAGNVLDCRKLFEADLKDGYRRGIVSVEKDCQHRGPKRKQCESAHKGARSSSSSILW